MWTPIPGVSFADEMDTLQGSWRGGNPPLVA
jgi:hypothetical protein